MTVAPVLLASCPCCGCLVLAFQFHDPLGRPAVLVWDPTWPQRRLIRSWLTRADLERQGFGLTLVGAPHECPPIEDCALGPIGARERRAPS